MRMDGFSGKRVRSFMKPRDLIGSDEMC
jgi:hypothetical protein